MMLGTIIYLALSAGSQKSADPLTIPLEETP